MYIKRGISYNRVFKHSSDLPKSFEHLLINVTGTTPNSKVIVGVLYRPPNSNPDWFEQFQLLHHSLLSTKNSNFILGGDLNISLLQKSNLSTTFTNLLTTLDLHQSITEPTRITPKGASILDLFITNNPSHIIDSGVLQHEPISDHETIFTIYKLHLPKFTPIEKTIRCLKNFNFENYVTDCQNLPFEIIYHNCNPDAMLFCLSSLLKSVIDKHAPLKVIKINKPPAPWLNSAIKSAIHVRNSLKLKLKINPDIVTKYKTY